MGIRRKLWRWIVRMLVGCMLAVVPWIGIARADTFSADGVRVGSLTGALYTWGALIKYNQALYVDYRSHPIPAVPITLWLDAVHLTSGYQVAFHYTDGTSEVMSGTINGSHPSLSSVTITPAKQVAYITLIDWPGSFADYYVYNFYVTTQVVPPAQPTGLTYSATYNSVTLSWKASSGAVGYHIYDAAHNLLGTTTSLSYQVTGLSPLTSYTYGVSAYNDAGESTVTTISVQTTAMPVPSAPTGLQLGTTTATSAVISWQPSALASSYNVYLNGTKIASVTGTSYTLTGLSPSTGYSISVSAVNSSGESPVSQVYLLTPGIPVTPSPTQVHSQGPLYGTGSISWTPGPGTPSGTVYYVYQSGVLLGTTTDTTYTLTNYNPRWPYTVSAQAPGWQMSAQVSDSPLGGMGWAFSPGDLLSNSAALVESVGGILLLVLTVAYTPRLVRYTRRLVGEHRQRDRAVDVAREIDAEWYAVDVPAPIARAVSMQPSAAPIVEDVRASAVSSDPVSGTLPLRPLAASVSAPVDVDELSVDLSPLRGPTGLQRASESADYSYSDYQISDSADYRYDYDFDA